MLWSHVENNGLNATLFIDLMFCAYAVLFARNMLQYHYNKMCTNISLYITKYLKKYNALYGF